MDIAVTGSSGLIGTALARSLRADGHRVVPIVRSDRDGDVLRWDPSVGRIDAAGFEGLDAVVHLAGEGIADKRWTAERKRSILESRTKGTSLLADTLATLDRPPKVFLSGSAIGYYGDRGDEVLTESSTPGDIYLSEVCTAWEAAAQPAVDAGIRTTFLRTGIVLSTEGGALAKTLPLFKLGLGGRLGSGRQWWSWITIADEVGAIRFLLDADVAGPVNLTAPEPSTNAEFTKTLGSVLGRPTVLPVPAFGPKLVLGGELAEQLLFSSQRVHPDVLLDAGYTFEHPDLPTGLRATLDR
ncbi:MAG: TIGR01777 family oxidoreductase [Acidimicrobiia bacterium]|nr:TIGR01777 family oxidoreductase [Acidimicrobiia bacterium]